MEQRPKKKSGFRGRGHSSHRKVKPGEAGLLGVRHKGEGVGRNGRPDQLSLRRSQKLQRKKEKLLMKLESPVEWVALWGCTVPLLPSGGQETDRPL